MCAESVYKAFSTHLNYKSQDFCEYDGKGDNLGIQTDNWDNSKIDIVSDIINIPVSDDSFDNILCCEVLEHLPEPSLAIKEFSRILKKGGRLILTAPFCSVTHFAPFHFCSGFNKYWYTTILPKYGFTIKEITPNGNYFDYVLVEIFRTPLMIFKNSRLPILSILYIPLVVPIILLLQLCSIFSFGSESLLCFGYHVICTKDK